MAGCFEYYAELAEKLDKRQGEVLQLPMAEFKGAIRREPLGVVGLITPWNYPMLMAAVSPCKPGPYTLSSAHVQLRLLSVFGVTAAAAGCIEDMALLALQPCTFPCNSHQAASAELWFCTALLLCLGRPP